VISQNIKKLSTRRNYNVMSPEETNLDLAKRIIITNPITMAVNIATPRNTTFTDEPSFYS